MNPLHRHHMIDPESPEGLRRQSIEALKRHWVEDDRWDGVERPYSAEEIVRYRGSMTIEYTLARRGAERLWKLLNTEDYVHALGAVTGNQAVQQVAAGLKSIYVSGWQVAADANLAGQMYPDQSLYPADSVPALVRRINHSLQRADQVSMLEDHPDGIDWFAPLVAAAEAGGVNLEDQLSSAKKCGHMGGKVLVPIQEFVTKLVAARMAADVCGVPTVLVARTDADSAGLLTSDVDQRDRPFLTGERTEEGFFRIHGGIECAIARGLAYAPYCDMIWCETSHPDLNEAKEFAAGIHEESPGKPLAYNCSPSFNWNLNLDAATIASFQRELGAMGYKYQFVTLAGFHALTLSMFTLATGY